MDIIESVLGIDAATFNRLDSMGVLRPTARRDIEIRDFYMRRKSESGSMQAFVDCEEKFYLSFESIRKIVYKDKFKKTGI